MEMLLAPIVLTIFALLCLVFAVIVIIRYWKTRTTRHLLLFVILLILALDAGLAGIKYAAHSGQDFGQSQDVSSMDPQQLVQTYYDSLAAGDYVTAKACLSDQVDGNFSIQQYMNLPDSDFTNIIRLTDITVSSPANIRLDKTNYQEVQVVAKYFAQYKKVVSATSGEQVRFIYVAKKEKGSPWKIISIGTGP